MSLWPTISPLLHLLLTLVTEQPHAELLKCSSKLVGYARLASHSSCKEHAFSKLCLCNVGTVNNSYFPGQLCIIEFTLAMISTPVCVYCVTQGLPAHCRSQVRCPLKCRYQGNSCKKPASAHFELAGCRLPKYTIRDLLTQLSDSTT